MFSLIYFGILLPNVNETESKKQDMTIFSNVVIMKFQIHGTWDIKNFFVVNAEVKTNVTY